MFSEQKPTNLEDFHKIIKFPKEFISLEKEILEIIIDVCKKYQLDLNKQVKMNKFPDLTQEVFDYEKYKIQVNSDEDEKDLY